ncbi:MAG: MEDS domain-containing protein [Fuerstiella sp.]
MQSVQEATHSDCIDGNVPSGMHICLIYSDESERRKTVSEFVKAGLVADECVGCFLNDMPPSGQPNWLDDAISSARQQKREDQLTVRPGEEAYFPHGEFVPAEMLDTIRDFCLNAIDHGFSGARITGDAGFVLKDIPGTEHFLGYEWRVNDLLQEYPATILCQYDANLFDGGTLYDVLRIHPMMIIHGQIVHNPCYNAPPAAQPTSIRTGQSVR